MDRIETLKETLQLLKKGGGIHIKKENRGKFTKSAKAAGEGVQEHAHKVMNNPNATSLQRKRANFAIQAAKWARKRKHADGGTLQSEYEASLDEFIKKNPSVHGLNTSDFRNFLVELVRRESSFNPKAKQGSYYGWYQTKIPVGTDTISQHNLAFRHLANLFRDTITKADVSKARDLGISDAPLLLKYWNQGNRVNNYLWNNIDSKDGLGTKISDYGNDISIPLNVYNYAMDNLTGDYTVQKGDNWFNLQKKVRTDGRDYNMAGKDLWQMQKNVGKYGQLQIGQKLTFGKTPEVTKTIGWDPQNKLSLNYKLQQGGLVYTPFEREPVEEKKKTTKKGILQEVDQTRFPVEAVKIVKINPVEWEPNPEQYMETPLLDNLSISNANSNNLNQINKELQKAGYKKTQRAAILATIVAESGANPSAIGDAGKARGLFQWHGNRFNAGIDLASQIQLALSELKDSDNKNAWSSSRKYNKQNAFDIFHNTEDLMEAISALTANFIRPANTDREIQKRYGIAQQLISQMV